MHLVPLWWEFGVWSQMGVGLWMSYQGTPGSWILLGGGKHENPWSCKLIALWWPFPLIAEPLMFLAYYLERTVYCLLGFLDFVGIICLCYLKCTFWKKNEPIYLTTTVWTFLCAVSLDENFCLETKLLFWKGRNWNIAFQVFVYLYF
jgi:hypothetical protein